MISSFDSFDSFDSFGTGYQRNESEGSSQPGGEGMPQTKVSCIPLDGADGGPQYQSDGVPHYDAYAMPQPGTVGLQDRGPVGAAVYRRRDENEKRKYDSESDRGLTLTQKRLLFWLTIFCNGKEKEFLCFYKQIGAAIGITKKAARVHVAALEKKKFIVTAPIYRLGSNQIIGKRVVITKYAPQVKNLNLKISEAEKQKRREMKRAYDETLKFWKNGGL